jgi:hypothetical protein
MNKLSSKQRAALAYFADGPRSSMFAFAAGTLSSLRKLGFLVISPRFFPRGYETTDAGRAAIDHRPSRKVEERGVEDP